MKHFLRSSALKEVVYCVSQHSHLCSSDDMALIEDYKLFIASKYEQACPKAISPLVCPDVLAPPANIASQCLAIDPTGCIAELSALDKSDGTLYELLVCRYDGFTADGFVLILLFLCLFLVYFVS